MANTNDSKEKIKKWIMGYAKEKLKDFDKDEWTFNTLERASGEFSMEFFNTHINYKTGWKLTTEFHACKVDEIKGIKENDTNTII